MKNDRREFLKLTGLTGVGLAGTGMLRAAGATSDSQGPSNLDEIRRQAERKHVQRFNMCGYAAPKLASVRIGFIGIGSRGSEALRRLSLIEGVDIKALCDLVPAKVSAAQKDLQQLGHQPVGYSGREDAWKELCERSDIDLVYTCTPWALHTPIAVYAMEHGKHAATEVPAVNTLEQCWQLVETSERTRKHCMMLENCCYDFFELLTLSLARNGFFGEIIHGEGAYIHNRLDSVFTNDPWRLRENFRKGNVYPTHGLGPLCQVMNINHGDKLDYLVSVSSDDFGMAPKARQLAAKDARYKEFADKTFRGNMNTSVIRTRRGRTIVLQHDCTSPRVYSRIHLVSGTAGSALKYPLPPRICTGDEWISPEQYAALEEKYTPELVRRMGTIAAQIGGHGGMDLLMDWRLIDCLRNGLPLDMHVYDAALWSSIGPLSEWSVANGSRPIEVPDFTGGSWKTNQPQLDISFARGGGATRVAAGKL